MIASRVKIGTVRAHHVGLAVLAAGCSLGGPGMCAPERTSSSVAERDDSNETESRDSSEDEGTGSTGAVDLVAGTRQEHDEDEGEAAPCAELPDDLETYIAGHPRDVEAEPAGPAWLLCGGAPGPNEALHWWSHAIAGGDVVVLRTDGGDRWLDLLWRELAPVDSVEILAVRSPEQASSEAVICRLDRAEGIFIAGGWQHTYVDAWSDSPIPGAVEEAWSRGAAIGGNSAGIAVMGELVFAAHQGTIGSEEALSDPYSAKITLERDFLALPLGRGLLFDTHFAERDRMGRSIAFLARAIEDGIGRDPIAIGIDEDTALVVEANGLAEVRGEGSVHVLRPTDAPQLCMPDVALHWPEVPVLTLDDGDQMWLPQGAADVEPSSIAAVDGSLDPPDPY